MDIETDKVVIEVVAPDDGVLAEILKVSGETITSNESIAKFEVGTKSEDSVNAPARLILAQMKLWASKGVESAAYLQLHES